MGIRFAESNRPSWDLDQTREVEGRARAAGMVTPAMFARALGIDFSAFMSAGCIPAPDVSSHPNPKLWSVGTVNKYLALMGRPLLPVPAGAAFAPRK
jgi:hypothetical protein